MKSKKTKQIITKFNNDSNLQRADGERSETVRCGTHRTLQREHVRAIAKSCV